MLCMSFIDSSCNIQAVYLTETYDKISGSFNPSRMQCSMFLFTNPFCATQKSLSVLVIKMNQLMVYMEIILFFPRSIPNTGTHTVVRN